MDLLFWKNKAPSASFSNTTKQYFGQFLWRMVIKAEAGRLAIEDGDVSALLEKRKERAKYHENHNWGWRSRDKQLDQVDVCHLQVLRDIKENYRGNATRVRIEEPYAQIYTQDEDTLKKIADSINPVYIESISGPRTLEEETLLNTGCIISKVPVSYRYKVVFRDKSMSLPGKAQILNYLQSLEGAIKITKGSIDMLSKPYTSMWGVYFYTNDPGVVLFLQLIDPKLISNIHEVVYMPQ